MTQSSTTPDRCTACGAQGIYKRTTTANGGYGPRLLNGLGRFLRPAKMDVYMCAECGHMLFFADAEARQAVKERFGWRKVK